jgi:phosphatidylglycerophosphate synthase
VATVERSSPPADQREEKARLDAAVKEDDGFFATFFVSPYSKYVARFAARRGWAPDAITVTALVVGLASAAAFALGTRAGLVAGAVLLQASFVLDCVDGQLARYARRFSKLGGWLDSLLDRVKEYAVYAGLALGSTRGFGEDVWALAAAALAIQTARHVGFAAYTAESRANVRSRRPRTVAGWIGRIVRFPIGERLAFISVCSAVATPRTTFVGLVAAGAAATIYQLADRLRLAVVR